MVTWPSRSAVGEGQLRSGPYFGQPPLSQWTMSNKLLFAVSHFRLASNGPTTSPNKVHQGTRRYTDASTRLTASFRVGKIRTSHVQRPTRPAWSPLVFSRKGFALFFQPDSEHFRTNDEAERRLIQKLLNEAIRNSRNSLVRRARTSAYDVPSGPRAGPFSNDFFCG